MRAKKSVFVANLFVDCCDLCPVFRCVVGELVCV